MGEAVRSTAWPRFALLYTALDATFGSASPWLLAVRTRTAPHGGVTARRMKDESQDEKIC
jgi:hypothetical protein